MAWLKLHTDVLGDPKLIRAARAGHGQLVLLPWLFAFAKQAEDGGRLSVGGQPAEPEDIAHQLPGVGASDVAIALASLEAIGVLRRDGNYLSFTTWAARQEKPSDSKSAIAERVRNHRSRNKKPVTPPSALHETPRNALQILDTSVETVTPCNATEQKEKERRREKETTLSPPARSIRVLKSQPPTADVDAVLAHHRSVHPLKRPDEKATKAVVKALLRGYSVRDLCAAIDGNAADPWCKKTKNQGLPYLLRDNATADKYLALATPAVSDARELYDYERMELSPLGVEMSKP